MGLRGALAWPFARTAAWVDDNPVSAVGAVVAVGALAALVVSAGVETGAGGDGARQAFTLDGLALSALVEAALAQPAYPIVAAVGLAAVVLYDG